MLSFFFQYFYFTSKLNGSDLIMLLSEKENLNYTKYDKELKLIDKHININRVSLEQLNKLKAIYNEAHVSKINVTSLVNLSIFLLLKEISEIESDSEALDLIYKLSEEFKVYEVLHQIGGVDL